MTVGDKKLDRYLKVIRRRELKKHPVRKKIVRSTYSNIGTEDFVKISFIEKYPTKKAALRRMRILNRLPKYKRNYTPKRKGKRIFEQIIDK